MLKCLKENNKKAFDIQKVEFIIAIVSIIALLSLIALRIRFFLDDDMSSDMVLGNLLFKEGKFVLSNNWINSTELRIMTTQFVFSILFRFFSSWHKVRVLGTILIILIFILCLYFMCYEYDLKNSCWLIIFCFLTPLNYDALYYNFIIAEYLVYEIYTILMLSLLIEHEKKGNVFVLFFSFMLSVIFCLEGSRFILIIYLPILCIALVENFIIKGKKLKMLMFSIINFFGGIFGVLINSKYLSRFYYIPGKTKIILGFHPEKLSQIINGLLSNNGYDSFFLFKVISIFLFATSLLCAFLSFKKSNQYLRILSFYYVFGLLGLCFCFLFSNIQYNNRYLLSISSFSIFVVICFVKNSSSISKNSKKNFVVIFTICYLVCGINSYSKALKIDNTSELDYISSNLVEKDYNNGYSFFWSSNVLTELSNGKIETWCLGFVSSTPDDYKNIEEIAPWLQRMDHYYRKPEGKVFLLLSNFANDKFKDLVWFFDEDDIVVRTNNYIAYGFESYQDMISIMHLY